MKRKQLLITGLILMITITLFGCKSSKEEIGKIEDVDIEASEAQSVDKPFSGSENNTGYKMLLMNDYYAGYSMPYPKKFSKTVEAANLIKLYDAKTNTTIYIEHSANDTDIESTDGTNADHIDLSAIKSLFSAKLDAETFDFNGKRFKRYIDQNMEKPSNGNEVNKKDIALVCEDYPNLNIEQDGLKVSNSSIFERRYYIQYKNMATVISLVTTQKNADTGKAIIDFMASNISGIDESFSKVKKLPITSGYNIKLPKQFKTYNISDKNLGDGIMYQVPVNSQSALAGMFIDVFDVDNKYKIEKDYVSGNDYFLDSFPNEAGSLSNFESTHGSSGGIASLFSEVITGKFKGKELSYGRITSITVYRTDLQGSRLIEHYGAWTTEGFVINKGGQKKLVIIGYMMPQYYQAKDVITKAF